MNIQPLGDRVVVKPLEAESKTKGGIVLPDTCQRKAAGRQDCGSPTAHREAETAKAHRG